MELTGPAGEYGQAGSKSVEMAFRDINDAGGINRLQAGDATPATARARATVAPSMPPTQLVQ